MNEISRKIGLGWTAEGHRVVAQLTMRPGDPERIVTLTDHSEAPEPDEVSVSFEVVHNRFGREDWISAGQTPSKDRVIVRRHENDASHELERFIDDVWRTDHLNWMNAACIHMEGDLNPPQADLEAYLDANPDRAKYGQGLQSYRIDRVVCAETGYRYGAAWLSRVVPEPTLTKIRTIIETGALPA